MVKRIRTTYISPTDTKGARIRATGGGRQLTMPYDHAALDAHAVVAAALAGVGVDQLRLIDSWVRGCTYVVVEG